MIIVIIIIIKDERFSDIIVSRFQVCGHSKKLPEKWKWVTQKWSRYDVTRKYLIHLKDQRSLHPVSNVEGYEKIRILDKYIPLPQKWY